MGWSNSCTGQIANIIGTELQTFAIRYLAKGYASEVLGVMYIHKEDMPQGSGIGLDKQ